MTAESIMVFLFGGGIIVGVIFGMALALVLDYWNDKIEYQKEIWEARIEYERNKDKYQRKEDKE